MFLYHEVEHRQLGAVVPVILNFVNRVLLGNPPSSVKPESFKIVAVGGLAHLGVEHFLSLSHDSELGS